MSPSKPTPPKPTKARPPATRRPGGPSRRARPATSPDGNAAALRHKEVRRAHATEIAEDYVEAIAELITSAGEARVTDLARRLGVSHVTVVRTVARLADEDLVTARPYRSIFLTDAGKALAERSRDRHEVVLRFLEALGVPADIAALDAEGIEHHVSAQTLAAFERYLRRR
jgi:DtxR family manganese transport transcriptional regulator